MSLSTATSNATPQTIEWLAALESEFGTSFELWIGREQWQRIDIAGECNCGETTSCGIDATLGALLSSAQEAGGPAVTRSGSLCRLAFPLESGPANTIVATAELANTSPDLLRRHAVLFSDARFLRRENSQLNEIKTALTHTVTESFEELIFLRELAAHLQLGATSGGPVETAEKLLPHLRATLRTEGVALISESAVEEPDDKADGALVQHVANKISWTGERRLDDRSCILIAQTFSVQARDGAVIQNDFQQHLLADKFPTVREFVLVEVNNGPIRRWLLAVNRELDRCPVSAKKKVGEKEFGTVETTFLSSAASFLATHFHNVELLDQKEELFLEVVRALVNAVEARDPYTCGHSERVALYSRRLGTEVGLDQDMCELLYLSGLLHDVGKIAVPDAVLRKPDKLSDDEFMELTRHPDLGWAILNDLKHLRDVLPGVLYHHERYDGRGYPDQLAGDAIPVEGRLLAICDAYDAMTSDRPYRKGMPNERAESIIRKGAGTQWDPKFVEAFFAALPDINTIRMEYRPRAAGIARRPGEAANG